MAKSKLARRVRKIRNQTKSFSVPIVNAGHCAAVLKAFHKAHRKVDRGSYWNAYSSGKEYVLCHGTGLETDDVGVYNHDGGFPCVKL